MKYFYSLICLIFLFSTSIKAEKISDISITGNQRVSDETIILYGKIDKDKDYSEVELNQVIQN